MKSSNVNLLNWIKQPGALAKLGSILALVVVGVCCFAFPFATPLERLSFDLPFAIRTDLNPSDVVLIYLDEESAEKLHQAPSQPWDRALHTQVLDRLTMDGARLVYYDIVFADPGPDEQKDRKFAEAMGRNGHVILSADFQDATQGDVYRERIFPPLPLFRAAAAGSGLAFFYVDPDFAVRKLSAGSSDMPSAAWVAAEKMGAPIAGQPGHRLDRRWMNYFGPSGTLRTVSFHRCLEENGVPPELFRDKAVFIGANFAIGPPNGRDQFANPYSRWGRLFSPGLEVHATEFLNLVHGNWLNRIPASIELILVALSGITLGIFANYLSPKWGVVLALAFGLLASVVTIIVFFHGLWWNWLVPVLIQTPIAVIWSTGSQYFEEARRRAALRQAFAYYVSPHVADKIAELDFDLKPGGKVVEASLLFTDCKGFTTVSEELNDPQKLAELLIEYFTQTSKCVLENGGTIIKYIGDAVMAAWGIPLEDPDHPRRAVQAGWAMSEVSRLVVQGRVLTTRVGVSTGKVLAGNLGSPYRFDYTCVGDTTNLASRLEGMNKMLGTSVLISDATAKRLDNSFVTRLTGHFAVAGKTHGIAVHEVLGPADGRQKDFGWIAVFAEALEAVKCGAFDQAKGLFRKTIWERSGEDGPSEFYLRKMADLEKADQLRQWTGVVRLDEK